MPRLSAVDEAIRDALLRHAPDAASIDISKVRADGNKSRSLRIAVVTYRSGASIRATVSHTAGYTCFRYTPEGSQAGSFPWHSTFNGVLADAHPL